MAMDLDLDIPDQGLKRLPESEDQIRVSFFPGAAANAAHARAPPAPPPPPAAAAAHRSKPGRLHGGKCPAQPGGVARDRGAAGAADDDHQGDAGAVRAVEPRAPDGGRVLGRRPGARLRGRLGPRVRAGGDRLRRRWVRCRVQRRRHPCRHRRRPAAARPHQEPLQQRFCEQYTFRICKVLHLDHHQRLVMGRHQLCEPRGGYEERISAEASEVSGEASGFRRS